MGSPNLIPIPNPDDKQGIVRALQKLASLRLNADSTPTFAELTLSGELTADGVNTGYVDYDPTASPGDGTEGRSKWNPNEHTLDLTTGLGPVLQIGQESFVLVYNDTGSTIFNGTAVHPVGAVAGRPSVAVAAANTHVTFRGVVLITTMDIPNGTVGIVSQDGKVRGVDTSGFDLGTYGNVIWLAEEGEGILNNITNIRPLFPSYAIQLGGIAAQDAADGVLQLEIVGKAVDTTQNFFNGTFREKFDFRVTEDAGTVTGTVTPSNGHPDMTMIFSDGFEMLDTDPGAAIDITAYVGTDEVPLTCLIWIPQSTKVLTAGTSWPNTVEHIRVATLVLQSATTIGTHGAYRNQNWNDEIQDTDTNQGHLSHLGQRIRAMVSEWELGAEATLTVDDTANSYISVTSGHVFQMHDQTYPEQEMPTNNLEVVNDPDTAYNSITTLDSITKTSDGSTISNNRWISVVLWGVANKTGETSHMMLNLPSGDYVTESQAQIDAESHTNYSIPKIFKGVGFLIARFTIQRKAGTINYTGGSSYQDLRGFFPNSTAGGGGGGGGGATTFLGLTDTPGSFVDEALKVVRVNVGETALEFATPSAGVTDHGLLDGLLDDDHTQYLLIDGTRAMTGDLDMDSFDVVDTGSIIPDEDGLYDIGNPGVPGGAVTEISQLLESTSFTCTNTSYLGQSFTTIDSFECCRLSFFLFKVSGTTDITAKLYLEDGGDKPTGPLLASGIVNLADVLVSPGGWVDFELDVPFTLSAATKYFIYCDFAGTGGRERYQSGTNPYAGGMVNSTSSDGSSWNNSATNDIAFKVWSTGDASAPLRYKDVFLSGNLSDGTDELTVAQAKEAYDHSLLVDEHIDWTGATDDFVTTETITSGSIFIFEKTTADTDIAGQGQFWVKDDVPCSPWFTDDDGEDVPLDTRYVDRGDTSSVDYEEGDLTADSNWYSLDLSSIMPPNAVGALITVRVLDDAIGSFITFRKNGYSNESGSVSVRTQAVDVPQDASVIVSCDDNQIIEYRMSNTTFTSVRLTVRAWWLG